MNYVIGVTDAGERLRFELWVYVEWLHGTLKDEDLLQQLRRCVYFIVQ